MVVTQCLTDLPAPYPDVAVPVHDPSGNIPYETKRMDRRCLIRQAAGPACLRPLDPVAQSA
jgi:hypothetical protein